MKNFKTPLAILFAFLAGVVLARYIQKPQRNISAGAVPQEITINYPNPVHPEERLQRTLKIIQTRNHRPDSPTEAPINVNGTPWVISFGLMSDPDYRVHTAVPVTE